ncbi:galactosyl transferase GMA12/MNN10 family domain-containing protein [Ditylenchus destructor]|nr:galactosyl transferase GMA12/MNN10 family domain-containing protein [Ditylenchus destructor]
MAIVLVVDRMKHLTEYKLAVETVNCYARMMGYIHKVIVLDPDLDTVKIDSEKMDPVQEIMEDEKEENVLVAGHNLSRECRQIDLMFRRHCVMAQFMLSQPQLELFLFVDGDIGVVNPHNHSLFDYIQHTNNSLLYSDDTNNSSQKVTFSHDLKEVDIVFYNRIFNWEISSGSYLARNTNYSRQFLSYWADYFYRLPNSFHGSDNGAIHAVFMDKFTNQTVKNSCHYLWQKSKSFSMLFDYEACVRHNLGIDRELYEEIEENMGAILGRIMILKKGRSWVRDSGWTASKVSCNDFMFHGWKTSTMNKPVFNPWLYPFNDTTFDTEKCSAQSTRGHELEENDQWTLKAELVVNRTENEKILEKLINKTRMDYSERITKLKLIENVLH